MKTKVLETSMLFDVMRGIYIVDTWFSDGTMETTYEPRGKIIIIDPLWSF